MTKEQQEILEQDREDTQEYINNLPYTHTISELTEDLKEYVEFSIIEETPVDKKDIAQEELDNIPVEEDLISDEELQEMQDSLDILLEQYTSNLDEIEKYKDIIRSLINHGLLGVGLADNNTLITSSLQELLYNTDNMKFMVKQLNKENKILLEEIKSLEFDINYYTNN